MDLARGLSTSIYDAERIKTLYGSVLAGGLDERDMISVPTVGVDERDPPQFVSRATLTRIIKPRVEEILEMVPNRLAASPFAAEPRASRVVAHRRREPAHRPARACDPQSCRARCGSGRPLGVGGMPDDAKGAAFAGRGGPPGLSAGGASGAFRTAANAASHDGERRLHRTGRTMASGKLLMTCHEIQPIGRGGPA